MDPVPDRVLGRAPVVPEDPAAPDPVGLPLVVRAVLHLVGRAELTDPVGLVVRADLHLVVRAVLDPVDLVVPARVGLDPAVRAAPADITPAGLVAPAELDLAVRVEQDPANLVVRPDHMVVPPAAPVEPDPAGPAARAELDPVVPADTSLVVPADTSLVVPVDLDRADLVVPADREDRVAPNLMGRVVLVDHRRRLMCSMVPSIAVARNSAVPGTHRTASAPPTTVLRPRPRSVGSAGTTGLLRGIRRRTGMGRRLPVVGTGRRLPVVGTRRGTVPRAT
jgi:hypothetical protein